MLAKSARGGWRPLLAHRSTQHFGTCHYQHSGWGARGSTAAITAFFFAYCAAKKAWRDGCGAAHWLRYSNSIQEPCLRASTAFHSGVNCLEGRIASQHADGAAHAAAARTGVNLKWCWRRRMANWRQRLRCPPALIWASRTLSRISITDYALSSLVNKSRTTVSSPAYAHYGAQAVLHDGRQAGVGRPAAKERYEQNERWNTARHFHSGVAAAGAYAYARRAWRRGRLWRGGSRKLRGGARI